MIRSDIISKIGRKFLQSNIENEEFSYKKALNQIGKNIEDYIEQNDGKLHQYLDIRFTNEKLSILVETKDNFDKWNKKEIENQLQAYVNYEKELTGNKIVAIIANTSDDRIRVWYGDDIIINMYEYQKEKK